MAEGKKRLYKRETVQRTLVSFVKQVRKVIEGETDFPDKLVNVIIFGSYVNSDDKMLHDLDVALVVREERDQWKEYRRRHPEQATGDWFGDLILPHLMLLRFLQNGKRLLSINYCTEDEFTTDQGIRRVALGKKHVYLVKDGQLCEDSLKILGVDS